MLYDVAVGFAVGFLVVLVVLVAVLVRNAWGRHQDWLRNVQLQCERLGEDGEKLLKAHEQNALFMWERYKEFGNRITEIELKITGMSGQGASDQAIAQLASRITAIEATTAEQHLAVLDAAEKIAHKLQDRRRKRDQEQLEDIDDVPSDPAQQLAAAKRAMGIADPSQLRLLGEERAG